MATPRFNGPHTIVKGFIATVALEANRLVIMSSSNSGVEYPAAQFSTAIIGVTLTAAAAGEMVDVCMAGICPLKVDGNAANIAVRDSIVAHDNTGFGQKAAGGAAGNRVCIAIALEASTADGDVIPVQVAPHLAYFAS